MVKEFCVSVDFTMSRSIYVEASSAEEAMAKVEEMVSRNPYGYTHGFTHYVNHTIVDANEVED